MALEDAHDLIPEELAALIPPLESIDEHDDPIVYVRLFRPDARSSWYVVEYDPIERIAVGLIDTEQIQEMGHFYLHLFEEILGPCGYRVERDLHWKPCPLSQVKISQHPGSSPSP